MTTTQRRILAVEDSATQAEMLRALLVRAGYIVEVATNGSDALRMVESAAEPFDVVISDIEMPGELDGYELCKRIKAGKRRSTPVVLLTSHADPMDIIKGLESGADNFFTKPYEESYLLQRLARLLETLSVRRRGSSMRLGVQVTFMGREFSISSEREQILDLLISTFEDAVQQNKELRQREADIEEARAELARYTGALETDIERFFELANDLICVVSKDGHFKRLNPAWQRLFGETEEDLLTRPYLERVHPDDRASTEREMSRLAGADAGTATFANRFRRRDGTYRWLEWRAIAVPEVSQVYAIARDVTERKEAERALEVRVRQQAAVAELGGEAIRTTDTDSLLQTALRLVTETLDVPLAKVLELSSDGQALRLRAGIGWGPELVGSATMPVDSGLMVGYALDRDEPVVLADVDAEKRFALSPFARNHGVRSCVAVVIPMHGRPFGVLGADDTKPRSFSSNDIHFLQAVAHILGTVIDRKRSNRRLQQSQRLESVGQLAGGIAHDFNNLLTVIIAHCSFLESTLEADAEALGEVSAINDAATRAAALTRQLLAFSSRQILEPKVLDVNETVTDVEKMLRRLIGEDIELSLFLQEKLNPVLADPGQLEQVIMNLMVNARDAMPKGGSVAISTENVVLDEHSPGTLDEGRRGPHVMLSISDTGHGMDSETQARMFEPFFTTKGPERGTGLGLATVYGIVKQSRGTLAVTSQPGQGTTFRVYLPVTEKVATGTVERPSARASGERKGDETILLVEDETSVRTLTARLLRKNGYTVIEAADGDEALSASASYKDPIHLLVSDIVMPRIHGGELARVLRKERPDLRVLHVSGHTDPRIVDEGLFDSGAAFLQKPFTSDSLARKVREVLDH